MANNSNNRLLLSRREFLRSAGLAAASFTTLSGLAGCTPRSASTVTPENGSALTLNALYMNQAGYSDQVLNDIARRYSQPMEQAGRVARPELRACIKR